LSCRCLRRLRLLPFELTYRQIAGRLFISMNMLKTHTQRIRRKLEVASRSEAVATARQRGLL
jgi:LuxR family transcriptional regulator, maltose regulon positive regulatory protein